MSASFKQYYESPTVEVVEVSVHHSVLQQSLRGTVEPTIWEN